jgi:hypothetical protein
MANRNSRPTARMPATKFPNLRKKLLKQPTTQTPRKKGR